jgi:hypothetical protein
VPASNARRERYLQKLAADRGTPKPTSPPAALQAEPAPAEAAPRTAQACPECASNGTEMTAERALQLHRQRVHGISGGFVEAGRDLDFMVPPGGLLAAEGEVFSAPPKTVPLGPALEAHWQAFAARRSSLKMFTKTVRALLRVLLREEHAMMEEARAESQRTGVPVRPKMGPLMEAVVAERRLIQAEASGAVFDE